MTTGSRHTLDASRRNDRSRGANVVRHGFRRHECPSRTNSRIEPEAPEVDDGVHDDEGRHENQSDRLDRREVLLQCRLHEEGSETVDPKGLFHHDVTGDETGDSQTRHRGDGNHGVAQHVANDDVALFHAAAARRLHVLARKLFARGGLRQLGHVRHPRDRERDGGQRQMRQSIKETRPRAKDGEPFEINGEHRDQDDGRHERRRGETDARDDRDDGPEATTQGREQSESDAERQ